MEKYDRDFRCVVKARKTMPSMSIEDILGDVTSTELEKEYKFLLEKAKADGYKE